MGEGEGLDVLFFRLGNESRVDVLRKNIETSPPEVQSGLSRMIPRSRLRGSDVAGRSHDSKSIRGGGALERQALAE